MSVARCRFQNRHFALRLLVAVGCCLVASEGCKPAGAPVAGASAKAGQQGATEATKPSASSLALTNITLHAAVQFTYRNGRDAGVLSIVESLGGGVAMLDFDLDGNLDLLFPGGGTFGPGETLRGWPAGLFQQVGAERFRDVSAVTGIDQVRHFTHGCTVGDYDNDGFPDVLITGYGGVQLFRNLGDGTWLESEHSAGLIDDKWSSSAGWGDLNGDGFLDLYLVHYVDWSWTNNPRCPVPPKGILDVCPPREFRGLDDTVYISRGDGTFLDGSAAARLRPEGKGLGVILADLDFDADLDVYVANDTVDNFLYLNDGHAVFEEVGRFRGVATDHRGVANGSMGVAVLDYNQDSLPDLWVANYENESFALYRNDGDASFTHVSESTGIFSLGSIYVGFGTGAADMDVDGDVDLVVSNGHVVYQPPSGRDKQPPLLLLNDRGRYRQCEFSPESYFGSLHLGRGLALGDLDHDGDLDCAFSNNNEPVAVIRNDLADRGPWLGLRLIGRRGNRDAIGAVAVLETTLGKQYRTVFGGGSYLSQHDPRLHWGLAHGDQMTGLTVYWPNGTKQTVQVLQLDRYLDLLEP